MKLLEEKGHGSMENMNDSCILNHRCIDVVSNGCILDGSCILNGCIKLLDVVYGQKLIFQCMAAFCTIKVFVRLGRFSRYRSYSHEK